MAPRLGNILYWIARAAAVLWALFIFAATATLEHPDFQKLANFFKNRDDMMQWIDWLTKPEKPAEQSGKVVHLKKPH
jgi:hypothetical protein